MNKNCIKYIDLVDMNIVNKIMSINDDIKKAQNIFLL